LQNTFILLLSFIGIFTSNINHLIIQPFLHFSWHYISLFTKQPCKTNNYYTWLAALCISLFATACRQHQTYKNTPTGKKVEIINHKNQYTLYRNGKPFFIKGAVGNHHIDQLAACGANTISTWDTIYFESVLNEAARYNMAVIAGLDIPGGEYLDFYKDPAKTEQLYQKYSYLVDKYKNHPALLAWCLGNELKMPFASDASPFYKTYNRLLQMMHQQDADHPITTTIINYQKGSILNLNWKIRGIDFISINTYNRIKEINEQLSLVKPLWNGPFMIAEWSPNGGWESETTVWQAPIENTSTKKAEQYLEFYKKYLPHNNPRFLGSMAFYWGNRQEYTHTWYSIFSDDNIPTEVKEVLKDCWMDTSTQHQSVKIKFMLLDSLGARDNIILRPASDHSANLVLDDKQAKEALRFHWQIKKEDWFYWGRTYNNFKKPPPETNLLKDSTSQHTRFVTPTKEGPYRIYITVYDNKGYCATANTPFYVIE
jgi:hypothetical protein